MDANILIAAFLRDSTVRRIITFAGLQLFAPEVILDEFEEHRREMAQRIGLGSEEAQALLDRLRLHLPVVPSGVVSEKLPEAKELMRDIDPDDALYLAAALSVECDGIWSDDPHLKRQDVVPCFTTRELVEALRADGVRF